VGQWGGGVRRSPQQERTAAGAGWRLLQRDGPWDGNADDFEADSTGWLRSDRQRNRKTAGV